MDKLSQCSAIRRIRCPSCGQTLLIDANNVKFSHNNGSTEDSIVALIHKICTVKNPTTIFICLQCGAKSARSQSRLATVQCKCPKKTDSLYPTLTPDTYSTETYITRVIEILSLKSGTSLDIDAIIRIITTSHDVSNLKKDCLLEAHG